ncbi:MAG: acyltransferase domain-containing protein [Candidatus Parabeggiatoa sp.]|nr:acyltransferase domain-containing protein [Candidatus Parabeggiatoa sp.]
MSNGTSVALVQMLNFNTVTRPWLRAEGSSPRRSTVNYSGGTHCLMVLEKFESEQAHAYRLHKTPASILLVAPTPAQLLTRCEKTLRQLQSEQGEQHYAKQVDYYHDLDIPISAARVGFMAHSLQEACQGLQITLDFLKEGTTAESFEHPKGIYYRKTGLETEGKVVALFAGQGSQYLGMGQHIALNFPPFQQAYADMDNVLIKAGLPPISNCVYPHPVFEAAQKEAQISTLQQTENAQPAIGTFSVGLYKILEQAGFRADFVAGHSFGELTALWAASVLTDDDYFFLIQARGQAMAAPQASHFDTGTMLAVTGDISGIQNVVKSIPNVSIANWNANNQVVLAATRLEIAKIRKILKAHGYSVSLLPVSAAFHTPLVAHAQKPFAEALKTVTFKRPKIPVYSNINGQIYPNHADDIQQLLALHMLNPVLFKQEIENLYAAGGDFFIEFGPQNILTNLVKNILEGKPHFAVALNASQKKDSDEQLRDAIIQLRVAGLALHNLEPFKSPRTAFQNEAITESTVQGSESVSEQAAFEQALQNKHQENSPIESDSRLENPSTPATTFSSREQTLAAITKSVENHQQVSKQNSTAFTPHQGEALHVVHQDYLNNMREYTQQFFQLIQQQYALLKENSENPAMLESFERSIGYLHEHQAQTQRVHEQYLKNQIESSQSILQWKQHSALHDGESTPPISKLPTEESALQVVSSISKPTSSEL